MRAKTGIGYWVRWIKIRHNTYSIVIQYEDGTMDAHTGHRHDIMNLTYLDNPAETGRHHVGFSRPSDYFDWDCPEGISGYNKLLFLL